MAATPPASNPRCIWKFIPNQFFGVEVTFEGETFQCDYGVFREKLEGNLKFVPCRRGNVIFLLSRDAGQGRRNPRCQKLGHSFRGLVP